MRIAIIGAGGVGGYFGGRMVEAGRDVVFIARGANLAALRERGLRVTGSMGDFHLPAVQATDDLASVGPVDLVLLCVKTYATQGALASVPLLVGPETVVVSLQNGIDAADHLAAVVDRRQIVGGLNYISAELVAPGEVRVASPWARAIVGEFDGTMTPRLQRIADAMRVPGMALETPDDIDREMWTKFMFIAVQGAMTSLTRLSIGPLRDNPPSWRLYEDALREAAEVAWAKGVRLPADIVEERLRFVQATLPGFRSSMLGDVEHGRRIEIDDFSGAIMRLGEQLSIPTPVHRVFYALLSAVDRQAAS